MEKKRSISLIVPILVVGIVILAGITAGLAVFIAASVHTTPQEESSLKQLDIGYSVGYTIKQTAARDIVITNEGFPHFESVRSVEVLYLPAGASAAINITNKSELDKLTKIGGTVVIKHDAGTPDDPRDDPVSPTHFTVIGTFADGKRYIINEADV